VEKDKHRRQSWAALNVNKCRQIAIHMIDRFTDRLINGWTQAVMSITCFELAAMLLESIQAAACRICSLNREVIASNVSRTF